MAEATPHKALQICILGEEEHLDAYGRRLGMTPSGCAIALLGIRERDVVASAEQTDSLFKALQSTKAYVATKNPSLAKQARAKGIRVIDRTADLKELLDKHPQLQDALRVFSPHVWRQQLKSQLQRMGLVTMPRLRIYSLVGLSGLLFFFVVFRLLPSADVVVKPRQEAVTQTVNVFLVQSGAQLPASRVRMLPLRTIEIRDDRSLTFDQISKQFVGTAATVELKISNASAEKFSLKKGTRFQNQAGMVFRTLGPVIIPAKGSVTMLAKADDLDAFDQIIGKRGNVPAGVEWQVPGLDGASRALVTAVNPKAASGGSTAYRTVLTAEDLEIAKKRLEQELLANAKRLVEERVELLNAENPEHGTRLLRYGELTKLTYSGFVIPTQFVGQEVASVPVEGGIVYVAAAYDSLSIMEFLRSELLSHVREGKRLLDERLSDESLVVHVIDYAEDLSWIKLTVDLAGTEEYVLDPLTPDGALFAKRVRDQIAGLSIEEALRIVRNMPEVETASVSMWPPWAKKLPQIPAHISVTQEE
jgi:hypothetical protein